MSIRDIVEDFPGVPDEAFEKPCSVVRPWVHALTFKQQTVLLTSFRGVDGMERQDKSKNLCKAMRSTLLQNASPNVGTFMLFSVTAEYLKEFAENIDHYPVHWLLHFLHATEIVGYKHPNKTLRTWWHNLYLLLVDAMHLQPETEESLDARLSDTV